MTRNIFAVRKGLIAAAAAGCLSLLGMASSASAGNIGFYTEGSFNGGAYSVQNGTTNVVSDGGYNLSFTGDTVGLVGPGSYTFGTWNLTGSGVSVTPFSTTTFSLEVFQFSPTAGAGSPGVLAGTFAGSLTSDSAGSLQVTFSPHTVLAVGPPPLFVSSFDVINNDGSDTYNTYGVYSPTAVLDQSTVQGGVTTSSGTPPEFSPTPKTATAGLGLLGLVGLVGLAKSLRKPTVTA